MIKIFFITFFISELIIASAITFCILKLDKKVLNLEKSIASQQNALRSFFFDIKKFFKNFNETVSNVKQIIKQKQQKIALDLLKQMAIFCGIILLKDKYRKKFLIFNLLLDIYREAKNEIQTQMA